MIDVAHDRHHRCARLHIRLRVHDGFSQIGFRIIALRGLGNVPKFANQNHRRFLVEHLVDRDH